MKKLISLLLTLAFVFSLTACSSSSSDTSPETTSDETDEVTDETTETNDFENYDPLIASDPQFVSHEWTAKMANSDNDELEETTQHSYYYSFDVENPNEDVMVEDVKFTLSFYDENDKLLFTRDISLSNVVMPQDKITCVNGLFSTYDNDMNEVSRIEVEITNTEDDYKKASSVYDKSDAFEFSNLEKHPSGPTEWDSRRSGYITATITNNGINSYDTNVIEVVVVHKKEDKAVSICFDTLYISEGETFDPGDQQEITINVTDMDIIDEADSYEVSIYPYAFNKTE